MELTRRTFLGGLSALVGGLALDEAIPFNRVWSFPSKIVIPYYNYIVGQNAIVSVNLAPLMTIYYDKQAVERFNSGLPFTHSRS